LTLAYVVAFINSALALVEAFGVVLTHAQEVSITAFVNAAVILAARVLHMPEKTPDGGVVAVAHIPELVTLSPPTEPAATVTPATETVA
jgi:hypothetical protein